jgi:hypothetical protein
MKHLYINVDLSSRTDKKISRKINDIELMIWKYVKTDAKKKGIDLCFFYGKSNQCFCLIALRSTQTFADVVSSLGNEIKYFEKERESLNNPLSDAKSDELDSEKTDRIKWKKDVYAMEVSESVLESICFNTESYFQCDKNKVSQYLIQYSFDEMMN